MKIMGGLVGPHPTKGDFFVAWGDDKNGDDPKVLTIRCSFCVYPSIDEVNLSEGESPLQVWFDVILWGYGRNRQRMNSFPHH